MAPDLTAEFDEAGGPGASYSGSPNAQPQFEAHIWVVAGSEHSDLAKEQLRHHGFKVSSKEKLRRDGRIELVGTFANNDLVLTNTKTRALAQALNERAAGFSCYRIRLEEKIYDEVFGPAIRTNC